MASFDTAQMPGVLYTEGEGDEALPDYLREHVGNWTIPAQSQRTYYVQFRPFRLEEDGNNFLASNIQITR